MADYQVGNLQIVFNAVDETSKAFDNLAKNLNAVKKAISNIGNLGESDLRKFGDSLDKIREKFSPLLADINGASAGLTAFNESTKRLGIKNVSNVVEAVKELTTEAEETTSAFQELTRLAPEGQNELNKTSTALVAVANSAEQVNRTVYNLNQFLNAKTFDAVSASVSNLASKWKNLYATTLLFSTQADNVTGGFFSERAVEELEAITEKYIKQRAVVDRVNDAFKQVEETYRRSRLSVEELTIEEYRNTEAKRKQRIEYLQAVLALGQAGDKAYEYEQELWRLTHKISDTTKELAKLNDEQKNTDKATKKSTKSFGKLFQSLKRIALYRILRTVLKEISQAFTETVKAFAEVDDSVNSTMSNISSSLSVIKLSFGSIILPLLQMIEPIIQQISVAFAKLANVIGQAMSTTGKYTQINANYWEDYRKQLEKTKGSLLDFDKIRALNTNKTGSLSDALIPNQTVDESDERVTKLRETFEKLRVVFSKVFDILKRVGEPVFEVFITLLDTAITVLTPVINAIAKFVRELDNMGLLEPIIWGITTALLAMGAVKVVNGIINVVSAISNLQLTSLGLYATIGILAGAIAYFVSSLDEIDGVAKVLIPVISGLVAVFAGLAVAKAAAAAGIAAPVQAGITAAALVAAIGMVAGTAIAKSVSASSNFSGSHGGGGFRSRGETSTFTAPTAGSEMNYSVSSAQQTTASNTSMESAMYNALVRYGSQNRGTTTENINLVVDGRTLATTTRQAANKMGLDFAKK